MKASSARTYYGSLLVLALSSCSVDTRSLTYAFHALATGGAPSGSPSGGDTGDGADLNAGAADETGTEPDAGGAEAIGGSSSGAAGASVASGGQNGAGGATVVGGAQGNTAGASTATAGSGGTAYAGPCTDLNQDSIDDCSQTLVQNSRFDDSVDGWTAEPQLTLSWSPTDASGKSTSGSASLSNTGPAGTMIGARQCIVAVPDATYDVAARVQLAAGQTGGRGGINVFLYDDAVCAGNLITGNTPIEGGVIGSWVDLVGTLWIPGTVHSMAVRLVADKPLNQQTLSLLIDDVLITRRE